MAGAKEWILSITLVAFMAKDSASSPSNRLDDIFPPDLTWSDYNDRYGAAPGADINYDTDNIDLRQLLRFYNHRQKKSCAIGAGLAGPCNNRDALRAIEAHKLLSSPNGPGRKRRQIQSVRDGTSLKEQ